MMCVLFGSYIQGGFNIEISCSEFEHDIKAQQICKKITNEKLHFYYQMHEHF